ncbi:O-antigen ligase family protein [Mucilaginibacter sp. PAMB04168]|uniref:O-antigen ligase family protein n=1 Tax=Mucilaginibacter sp. PAMB04168 TaxID=3138567 RepID=UPI0031F659BE
MMTSGLRLSIKEKLSYFILLFIGFQQFPVIRIGGSLKIYEVLALILLVINLATYRPKKISLISLMASMFFVVSPIVSYVFSLLILDYPYEFYNKYPAADGFKFNYYIFPLLQLVYMFFNYAAFNSISTSLRLAENIDRLLRGVIIVGTIIATYSIIATFTVDVITYLPNIIQNKSVYTFRSSGLSQEPSFYVLYQSWICLFVFFTKRLFNKAFWITLLVINVLSLILTFSSTLVGLTLVIVVSIFLLNNSFKVKLMTTFLIMICFFLGAYLIAYYDVYDAFEYTFITKVQSFFAAPEHTLDSGSYRSYTGAIGMRIFKEHFFTGVGVGNSVYYMHIYEFRMGIITFGEMLQPGAFPQNVFSSVLSEQGIFGGIFLFMLLFLILKSFWKYRNSSGYSKMFFIGASFNIITMFTIAPVYSFFLWAFLALGLCYLKTLHTSK